MPTLTNSKGEPTGAVYGVVNMLKRLLAEYRPEHIAMVFDAKGKTFRHEIYPDYKANRPPMPEELRRQIPAVHAIVKALGLPMLVVPNVEADDVIGTLAKLAEGAGMVTIISTGDKDMAQLVDENTTMVNTMDSAVLDPDGVFAKFGVRPEQIVDYLTLVGDTVDNVPGVPKVGPKTAAKWLAEHGSLEDVVANASLVKGKVGESLRASLEQIPVSRDLVTIRCDVPLEMGPQDMLLSAPDTDALRGWYSELEFKTWLGDLLSNGPDIEQTTRAAAKYVTITRWTDFLAWVGRIRSARMLAIDTETTSLDYMRAEIVGLSFAVDSDEAAYLPLGHDYPGAPDQLDRNEVLGELRPLLEDPEIVKVGQNLKYDMSVLARYGIELRGVHFDTMLESYVLDSTATRHDMDSLALKYLGRRTIHFEEVAGKGTKQLGFNEVAVEKAAEYAAEDADVTWCLHHRLWPTLAAEPSLRSLYETIEVPLVEVLSRVERNGVLVDRDLLARQSNEAAHRLVALEREAHELASQPFNLSSPKQIQEILFEKLRLPILAKTPKGQPSTAESVLQELATDYPLPRVILEHRGLAKLRSTYLEALPARIQATTGRVHTSYHQAVAATGRLSSTDPNLQNIPIRSADGRRIRRAFVAPPGFVLVAADYSQIELRIMAHLSGDEGLLAAFSTGADIHTATAAEVFGIDLENVDADQRRRAKAINFGLIYGMSAFGLARQLGIGRTEAQKYVELYFARYPGVKAFMDAIKAQAHDRGYVETVFGRRLYLPEISSRNAARRQYAERTAINAPMQGTAADIIKIAMIALHRWISDGAADVRMIMQVHDELVFEVPEDQLAEVKAKIGEQMQAAADLRVPLIVDLGVGRDWEEAH